MSETDIKPLNWKADPDIGYTVTRRPDGGMNYIFTDLSPRTIKHWREFSIQHLLDSDRLTRNLYDLRQVAKVPHEAVQVALELGEDPAARNIRLAVVVANDDVRKAIEEIALLASPGGVDVEIFTSLTAAETWLNRPLTLLR